MGQKRGQASRDRLVQIRNVTTRVSGSGQSRSLVAPVPNIGYRQPPTVGSVNLIERPKQYPPHQAAGPIHAERQGEGRHAARLYCLVHNIEKLARNEWQGNGR